VTFLQAGDDLAGGEVHRREQVDSAVAFVVVGHRAGPAPLHRQRGLGAIQRLALGLLVEAEYHRPRWRVEIQADHIDQLLLEQRIVTDLERVDPPRLETMVGPDPRDRVLADPHPGRHRPSAPVRRSVRGPLVSQPQHLSHRARRQRWLATTPH
jgi:hypothetical protein